MKSTAYLEAGKPWYNIANELGESKFDRDKKDWHDWASKLGAKEALSCRMAKRVR